MDCIKSIYANYRINIEIGEFEIIVVDNNSTDGTCEIITKDYTWVTLVKNAKNVGFSKANNLGVKKSKGEVVLFLNPDTIVPAKTLEFVRKILLDDKSAGIATCKVLLPDGGLDDASHRGFPTPWRAFTFFLGLGTLLPRSNIFNGYHLGYQDLHRLHQIDACAGAFLMIKRVVGQAVGWFDEDYFWYGEDLDLCFRVKKNGYKVLFVPDVSIFHYKGAASGFKKHSAHLSKIDDETKKRITNAR
ncbi:MAG: glycosyltransferase family 2 protein, partial [Patescibacteria group bacterium]